MAHDLFISYCSEDKPTADAVCARLEERDIRCWIAPRDILPGRLFPAAILEAVSDSRVLVLILSSRTGGSRHVPIEGLIALDSGVTVIPFRVEDVLPSGDLGYLLKLPHWLDAITPPLEARIEELCDAVELHLRRAAPAEEPAKGEPAAARKTKFSDYLAALRRECERAFASDLVRPDRVYVPQFAVPYGEEGGEMELAEVAAALWAPEACRLAVLGNYGMGKTYLTWRAVLEQVAHCEADLHQPVPILYPLRKFDWGRSVQAQDPRDLLEQVLEHAILLGLPRIERREFGRWLEDGLVGLILDGLDELTLPRGRTWMEALAPVTELTGLHLLLTSRTLFIERPGEELAAYRTYEMLPWGEREWTGYVQACAAVEHRAIERAGGAEAVLAAVAARTRIRELTTRPLWCFMIVEIADRLEGLEDVELTGLYQEFLDTAVKRRPLMDAVLSLAWQYRALERFAEECVRQQQSFLGEAEMLRLLTHLYESVGHEDLQVYLRKQLRRYAFLNCDRDRHYNFGHKSFEEYFCATAAARWLAEQATGAAPELPLHDGGETLLSERRFSREQVDFVVGILGQEWIQRSLELVPSPETTNLHSKTLLFLQRELGGDSTTAVARANLFRIYLGLLRAAGEARPLLSGLCLRGANLAGSDLAGCTLQNVDFSDAILSGACLAGSSFAGCVFFGAQVDGADFTGADLTGADLVGIEPGKQPPVFTDVTGLDRARITARERPLLGS